MRGGRCAGERSSANPGCSKKAVKKIFGADRRAYCSPPRARDAIRVRATTGPGTSCPRTIHSTGFRSLEFSQQECERAINDHSGIPVWHRVPEQINGANSSRGKFATANDSSVFL